MICYSLPYNWFYMDKPHFKLFKEWLLANNVIDMEELMREIFQSCSDTIRHLSSIPVSQDDSQSESEASEDSNLSSSNARHDDDHDASSQ